MRIACTIAPGRGDTDLLLAQVALRMEALGYRLCGTVQTNTACAGEGPCDMDVKVLPDGPVIRISQSLGKAAKGCRLDAGALETAIAATGPALGVADLMIVNKFGKQEAAGRGFRDVIAEALSRGLPVLVGLNALNRQAFDAFTGGATEVVEPDEDALVAWFQAALSGGKNAA